MLKKIIFLLVSIWTSSFSIGDLEVNVVIHPVNKTKKYILNDRTILDSGVINSEILKVNELKDQKIATISVIMKTLKPSASENVKNTQYCILDGEFNSLYKLKKIENNSLEREIPINNFRNYFNGENVILTLYEKNFRLKQMELINSDPNDDDYIFSAYPNECKEIGGVNIVTYLEYEFDLVLDIKGAQNGSLVGNDIIVQEQGIESAVGSAADLVKRQFLLMQY